MKLRYKILLILILSGTLFGLGRCQRSTISGPKLVVPAVLPTNDVEQLIVNREKGTLEILKPSGNQTIFLPERSTTIDVTKKGTINVTSPQSGFEHIPFIGVNQGIHIQVMVGADLFYLNRLDLGIGLMDRVGLYTPSVFVMVSYNVWSNVRVGLSYDNQQHIGAGLSVRL